MSTQLYTVNVTDLGSYRITVAADTPAEAEGIAKTVLFEEMTATVADASIVKREAEAQAQLAEQQPLKMFRVTGTLQLQFHLAVPALGRGEAERHARRLYDQWCGPFEFEHDGGTLVRMVAEEVVS
jgi:hypothetical protein